MAHAFVSPNLPCSVMLSKDAAVYQILWWYGKAGRRGGAGCGCQLLSRRVQVCIKLAVKAVSSWLF